MDNETLVTLTADIAAAFVSNNRVATTGISELISSVHAALSGLEASAAQETPVQQEPAVPIRASVKPDYIVCLEDGKKLKMLKRHLMTRYQMTPAQYREKWNLKADYPMVAPNYSETRKSLALKSGLGKKPAQPVAEVGAAPKGRRKAAPKAATTQAPAAASAPAVKASRKVLKPALGKSASGATPDAPKRGRRKAEASA